MRARTTAAVANRPEKNRLSSICWRSPGSLSSRVARPAYTLITTTSTTMNVNPDDEILRWQWRGRRHKLRQHSQVEDQRFGIGCVDEKTAREQGKSGSRRSRAHLLAKVASGCAPLAHGEVEQIADADELDHRKGQDRLGDDRAKPHRHQGQLE